jgi:hypothetical protein
MSTCIAHALADVALGPQVTFQNLTMVPLLQRSAPAELHGTPNYLVLDDALARGGVEITEVSEQGRVPDLRVVNRGPEPVLIVDGEELVGAKQNRVVNLTILVPAASELTIPVSCVEAGRWRSRSKTFAAAPRAQYATGRARKMAQVTASMSAIGSARSDQAQVWDDIAEKSARLDASSPTAAMEAIFTRHAGLVDAFVSACRSVDRQVGALFVVNGRVIGFDVFDRPETLCAVLPKIVRSVAIDALDAPPAAGKSPDPLDLARLFLGVVAAAPSDRSKALGLGDDVRMSGPGLTAAALVTDEHVVHASGFAI